MTTRIESIVNPFHGVRADLTPIQQATLALAHFFQKKLGLEGNGLEKLDVEVSVSDKPTIKLMSSAFVDDNWVSRGVQTIQLNEVWTTSGLDDHETASLQQLSGTVLALASKVDQVVHGASSGIPQIMETQVPVIVQKIQALKDENARLKAQLSQFSDQQEQLEEIQRQLAAEQKKPKSDDLQMLQSRFRGLALKMASFLQQGWNCRKGMVTPGLFNLLCLDLNLDANPLDQDQINRKIGGYFRTFKIDDKKLSIASVSDYTRKFHDNEIVRDKSAFDNFARGRTKTKVGINQILAKTMEDYTRFLDKLFSNDIQSIDDLFTRFPNFAANLTALQNRLTAIKVMYMALEVDGTVKQSDLTEIDYIEGHISKIVQLNKTLITIKQLLNKLLDIATYTI